MGSQAVEISWPSISESFDEPIDVHIDEGNSSNTSDFIVTPKPSAAHNCNIPPPPPLLRKFFNRLHVKCCHVPKETRDVWDKLFKEGFGADVRIITEDGASIAAHYSILTVTSPVLGNILQQLTVKKDIRYYLRIPGVPYDAVFAFIRFLYSSCYEDDDMKKFVLHLLVLSHCYVVPALKRVCEHFIECGWLTEENVIDVLQLARSCDAPRLAVVCLRMVVRNFKRIVSTEGWKVMRRANPALEQELLESIVEAESRKEERIKKIEEKKVYLQLHETMEALLHICRDGCRTIRPHDKVLKGGQGGTCSFPACKGLETLVRHFSGCKTRVPGGCAHCKRMWQLLELHSRMCNDPDYCKVPLCQHFKVKMQQQSKKDETKWKILVSKVTAAKNAQRLFSSQPRSDFY